MKSSSRIAAVVLSAAPLLLQGCGAAFPNPPARATSFPNQDNLQPSVVAIPLSLRVRNVRQALNRSNSALLDTGWRAVESASGDSYAGVRDVIAHGLNAKIVGSGHVPTQFRLTVRRGPVELGTPSQGGTVRVAFNDKYQLELRSPAGGYVCAPRNHAVLQSVANVASVVRPDGSLQSNVSNVSGRLMAACNAADSLLRDRDIDLTPAISAVYARALYAASNTLSDVLQHAADLALRVKFATLATQFSQPIAITPTSWLTPNLQNAAVRNLTLATSGNDLFARFDLGIAMRPQISLGSQPTASPAWPPRFASLAWPDGFHLPVDVRVPYDLVRDHARSQLRGMELPVKFIGTVRIDDVDVYATDNGTAEAPHPQLVVQIDFTGSSPGKLYMWGTPTIDPATRVISMPDLNYTADTRRLLIRFFAPVIMSNFVVSRVRAATTFDASTLIDEQTQPFMRPYDASVQVGPGTTASVHAVPSPVGLNGIALDAQALYVRVALNAAVNVNVDTSIDAVQLLAQQR